LFVYQLSSCDKVYGYLCAVILAVGGLEAVNVASGGGGIAVEVGPIPSAGYKILAVLLLNADNGILDCLVYGTARHGAAQSESFGLFVILAVGGEVIDLSDLDIEVKLAERLLVGGDNGGVVGCEYLCLFVVVAKLVDNSGIAKVYIAVARDVEFVDLAVNVYGIVPINSVGKGKSVYAACDIDILYVLAENNFLIVIAGGGKAHYQSVIVNAQSDDTVLGGKGLGGLGIAGKDNFVILYGYGIFDLSGKLDDLVILLCKGCNAHRKHHCGGKSKANYKAKLFHSRLFLFIEYCLLMIPFISI